MNTRQAERLIEKDPVPSGTPDPEQRYEPTEDQYEIMRQARDLSLTTLPGEQVAVAAIELAADMWASATSEQQQQLIDWIIEDMRAWRKFWKVGE